MTEQVCWLVANSVALRFFVLFVGVMSCFYSIVSCPSCHVVMRTAAVSARTYELEYRLTRQWDIIDVRTPRTDSSYR